MKNIYDVLTQLHIVYEKHEHPAVFTVAEAEQYDRGIDAGKSKNLFLRNKKGGIHYLVVVESRKTVDLKRLSSLLGENKLSFASPQRLAKHLALTPGSVSPFGLINNTDKSVHVIIDMGLMKHPTLAFHPNVNTATLVVKTDDFGKFLDWTGNTIAYLEI